MKAPDKIYVREYGEGISQMWSRVKATETTANVQHEYISKDTLLKWAKTKLSHLQEDFDVYTGQRLILRELIDKIESL